jgi:hypothetical protein
MTFDLYLWSAPRDLGDDRAAALLDAWNAAGSNPSAAPFEPTTDLGWCYRELADALPGLDAVTDAVPSGRRTPVWASGTDEPPARIIAIRLSASPRDELAEIASLAAKYDLSLFDARTRTIHRPLEELASYASATFWPRGAVQAAVAGGIGLLVAVGAWFLGIPIVSGLAILVGGFMFVMAVYTFVHEGRAALRRR